MPQWLERWTPERRPGLSPGRVEVLRFKETTLTVPAILMLGVTL